MINADNKFFGAQSIQNIIIGPKGEIPDSRGVTVFFKNATVDQIQQIWNRCGDHFTCFNYSAALSRLNFIAKNSPEQKEVCRRWGDFLAKKLDGAKLQYDAKTIAIVATALHALQLNESHLFSSFADFLGSNPEVLRELDLKSIIMLANGYSGQEACFDDLYSHLSGLLLEEDENGNYFLDECDNKDLAMLAHAFSKQNGSFDELFAQINNRLLKVDKTYGRWLDCCNSRDYAMIVNAFSKLDDCHEDLFIAMGELLCRDKAQKLSLCNSQEIAHIANGYSKQKKPFKEVFGAISASLLQNNKRLLIECENQHLAMIIDAVLKKNPDEALLKEIKSELLKNGKKRLVGTRGKEVVMLINSMSRKWKLFYEEFSQLLQQHLKDKNGFKMLMEACSPSDLANLFNNLSCADMRQAAVFANFTNFVLQRGFSDFDADDLILIVNGFVRVSGCLSTTERSKLFSLLLKQLTSKVSHNEFFFEALSCEDLVQLVRAFSLTNLVDDQKLFSMLVGKLLTQLEKGISLSPQILFELYQMRLAHQKKLMTVWSEDHFKRLNSYLNKNKYPERPDDEICSSKLQEEIFERIKKKYPDCLKEQPMEGAFVDIFLPKQKLAIEVNGPHHYIQTEKGRVLDFRSSFKYDLLKALGYSVSIVDYDEWDGLKTEEARSEFIKKVIH